MKNYSDQFISFQHPFHYSTIENEDQEMYQDSTVQSPDQVSVISAPVAAKSNEPQQEWCIALYDYDASAEDELTFEENQIIKIVNKSPHGVDDGWWEGELNGVIGNFPSLVVEECDSNGEPLTESDDETPPPSIPPVFSPPKAPMVPFMAELQQAVQKVEVDMGKFTFITTVHMVKLGYKKTCKLSNLLFL